jgi:predicted secreted hydrolase
MSLLTLPRHLNAQGFAGLGESADGFAPVTSGRTFTFPADHGSHPDFRIEWWYVTANLTDAGGARYGAQWTLFRQAMTPGDAGEGWDSRQIWMGHAAVTSAATHRFAEAFSRGGVGTAGVDASPLNAWIDAWQLKAGDGFDSARVSPLDLTASAADFSVTLRLESDAPLALQGDGGYSRKSERGQASYYYSQPFFRATGGIAIDGRAAEVTGQAWLDREFSSQPLSGEQTGWDWLSLHLGDDAKLMLFRLREKNGGSFLSGNWIAKNSRTVQLNANDITMTPLDLSKVAGRSVPTSWRIKVASRGLDVTLTPLNPQSWMGTRFPYWEGPVSFTGSSNGVGYLEMTGY